ncbi:histidine triad protein HinT [Mycoplasma crocodyli]|uniref:Histidine triad nucleotide-binding (HIT-like) protein n=1 Tax=Mycoplasma crocodyli (strain ATCC 51981 / MP145) TaxID=512564 RepID=D5E6E9_MYCCM|nr:HIT family protein [Mycoplasma crocodyli]ADE19368.1 histidine triad nucleotide-binding (HIT-like) protein [Mycoplasma crocodyli MP145]
MADNVFQKIINKEIPAEILYEDDKVVAFLDAFPEQPGHFLVVPKESAKNLLENSDEIISYALIKARELAKKHVVDKGIGSFKLIINTGSKAGQTVFHTHIHIIPYK